MSTVKANDLTNVTGGIPTVKSQQLIPTAWVNFNGTGTVAIRDSENVSSITDNNTGVGIINFTTNLANTTYAIVGSANAQGSQAGLLQYDSGEGAISISSFGFRCSDDNGVNRDSDTCFFVILGGQS